MRGLEAEAADKNFMSVGGAALLLQWFFTIGEFGHQMSQARQGQFRISVAGRNFQFR